MRIEADANIGGGQNRVAVTWVERVDLASPAIGDTCSIAALGGGSTYCFTPARGNTKRSLTIDSCNRDLPEYRVMRPDGSTHHTHRFAEGISEFWLEDGWQLVLFGPHSGRSTIRIVAMMAY